MNYEEKDPITGESTWYFKFETDLIEHFMNVLSFIGWLMFVTFAGVGFVVLPWELFTEYIYRPK